ncbi:MULTISPECIES: dipeptidase [unclassified Bacillus (in: firmicutes)]|uniref:dipeptidase n=1 Tax=unclassified Bacillus (in: firmicutes) TaxID=185979 RepID=UPI0008E079FF|nr:MULTISPECIES: dipeptidase [unclassified Bacillus (in: firmicutes)]SFA73000.1 membrane dipeptidase [Bacillus sp. UNCCL13]SFQ63095.1 membrane dipeptidase [Bacillus sp. cl95]
MRIFDAHCDVLYKMFKDSSIDFSDSSKLHVNASQLVNAKVQVQCFAIFVSPSIHPDVSFHASLYMVDIFFEKILKKNPNMRFISHSKDINTLKENEVGAILTLEGCDAIGRDIVKLKTLLRLGVSSVGLTWNDSNHVADGAMEERAGGLTRFGMEVLRLLNDTNTWCDVSHLSERGFWDVIEWADHPFASHSNCYSLCPHPRNLNDQQIEAIIERNSVMGLTFVPEFLSGHKKATITDVLRHLEHICELGGENHVGFGSDFDGIDDTVMDLSRAGDYMNLVNELQKYYSEIQVKNFLFDNMAKRYTKKK